MTSTPAAGGFFAGTVTVAQGLDLEGALAAAQVALSGVTSIGPLSNPKTLPTSPSGLSSGAYWLNGGVLSVVP